MDNTRDLSKFGYRERSLAGDLLKVIGTSKDKTEYLSDEIAVEFNPNSGCVFLVDDRNGNAAMMNGDNLEDWFTCPYCGHEGFKKDMEHEPKDEECTRYLKDIGVL